MATPLTHWVKQNDRATVSRSASSAQEANPSLGKRPPASSLPAKRLMAYTKRQRKKGVRILTCAGPEGARTGKINLASEAFTVSVLVSVLFSLPAKETDGLHQTSA